MSRALVALLSLSGCVTTTTSLAPAQISAGPGAAAAILVRPIARSWRW